MHTRNERRGGKTRSCDVWELSLEGPGAHTLCAPHGLSASYVCRMAELHEGPSENRLPQSFLDFPTCQVTHNRSVWGWCASDHTASWVSPCPSPSRKYMCGSTRLHPRHSARGRLRVSQGTTHDPTTEGNRYALATREQDPMKNDPDSEGRGGGRWDPNRLAAPREEKPEANGPPGTGNAGSGWQGSWGGRDPGEGQGMRPPPALSCERRKPRGCVDHGGSMRT